MPLATLPTVLLQLLCQQLDRKSLLRFARCCSSILAAASSTVAWRFAGPIPVSSSTGDFSGLRTSLFRFADVSLSVSERWSSEEDKTALLVAVSAVPRVTHLQLNLQPTFGHDGPDLLSRVLTLPNLEGVRQLAVTQIVRPPHAVLLEQHIRGLHSLLVPMQPLCVSAECFPRLPALTHLAIGEPLGSDAEARTSFDHLGSCAQLTELRLHHWSIGRCLMLLSLPLLASRLVVLELTQMPFFQRCLPSPLASAFARLVVLRSLRFASTSQAVEIAEIAAAESRSLTSVRLQDPYSSFWQSSQTEPYLAQLREVLTQRELLSNADPSFAPLCIEIHMQSEDDWLSSNLDSDSQGDEWSVMREQAEAMAREVKDAKCKLIVAIDPPREDQ